MTEALEHIRPSGAASPTEPRPTARAGRQKAAVLLVSLGAERAARGLRAPARGARSRQLSLEMAKMEQVQPDTVRGRLRGGHGDLLAAEYIAAGRLRVRARGARERRSARSAPRRSSAACRRSSRCGRSSSCAARRRSRSSAFLRDESPQTMALVDRQPAHDARRRRCSRSCRRRRRRRWRCGSRR